MARDLASMIAADLNADYDAGRFGRPAGGWRRRLFGIVFESNTPAGRLFNTVVIVAIVLSVAAVIANSVEGVKSRHGAVLDGIEWMFTVLFTIEYLARLVCVDKPLRYARSFFGIVDLAAVLPTYLAFVFPEAHVLIDVRVLRLVRVFRIFKLTRYLSEVRLLGRAMANSMRKILVFLSVVDHGRARRGDAHVRDRRARERLHEHSEIDLLGTLDDYNRRLWRHRSENGTRTRACFSRHAHRLGHTRGAHRHRDGGNDGAKSGACIRRTMCGMRSDGACRRRDLLQALRSAVGRGRT